MIPRLAGSGTWQTHAVYKADDLHSVDKRLANEDAAMLLVSGYGRDTVVDQVNPPTAYRMLHDFGKLDSHSLVVQNGATSGVGRAVIQLADRWVADFSFISQNVQTLRRPNSEHYPRSCIRGGNDGDRRRTEIVVGATRVCARAHRIAVEGEGHKGSNKGVRRCRFGAQLCGWQDDVDHVFHVE